MSRKYKLVYRRKIIYRNQKFSLIQAMIAIQKLMDLLPDLDENDFSVRESS